MTEEFYINNSSVCCKIMRPSPFDTFRMAEMCTSYEYLKEERRKHCIEYIERNPNKAIKIGRKSNATSVKISKEFFDILSKKFPLKIEL